MKRKKGEKPRVKGPWYVTHRPNPGSDLICITPQCGLKGLWGLSDEEELLSKHETLDQAEEQAAKYRRTRRLWHSPFQRWRKRERERRAGIRGNRRRVFSVEIVSDQ